MNRLGLGCALGLASLPLSLSADPARVTLEQASDGTWQLRRNGEPYVIRGAGGYEQLEVLRESGGNTIRTWGVEQLGPDASGEPLLDRAARLGLCVLVGLWVDHPRHGFDYGDEAALQRQRERILTTVRRYKDHAAVLMWGLGNEMEEDGSDPRIWRELEVLARLVKAADPDHPVCTILAGTYNDKVRAMMPHYSAMDLLGINIYGGAEGVDDALAAQGWERPYLITEFGPVGHWEIETTSWGAPIEPTSAEKAATYANAHRAMIAAKRQLCLGTFCFLWGQKQETTATWFSMFLPSGEKTPSIDAMVRSWTGVEPIHPSPVIHGLQADFREKTIAVGSQHTVTADVTAPAGAELQFDWQVVAETHDRKFGGDPEERPPVIAGCVVKQNGATVDLRLPAEPGAYRVFLYVRDGHGGGAAGNFPFKVE
ncbi:glycoside hydrolase family 2 TIM barrel-domain containing protein [Synoicihabitans lomoniglobus]|uniref:Glycoside hydrolase family 2 TIM barrel-domain containing protein n=1 Tax=Synoicihabitans lomoniglobus TaxID=2909285 RepID=A0AAF0CNX2_9BACT|nr:glycosyl hydrolase family 2 [Opitutaceae bacterium LMO-M01]WED65196.1 glycoside hydrolase family 2 TIM barrel-domain containing protein [Opitutaceae bacterium LMO-M01]